MRSPRSRRRVRLFVFVLILGALWALWLRLREPAPGPDQPLVPVVRAPGSPATPGSATAAPVEAPRSGAAQGADAARADSSSSPAPSPAAAPLPVGEAAVEAINDLVVTYDAASVPALARFLRHSDPEIRAAAIDGFIQLGERAAIPLLQEAARSATPEDAKAMLEAAEFLALPTRAELRAQQKAQAANTP